MDDHVEGGSGAEPTWPQISTDLTLARETAKEAAVDHQKRGADWVIHRLTKQLEDVTARLEAVESGLQSEPPLVRRSEVDDLSSEMHRVSQEHARRTRDLTAAVERVSSDLSQSDQRLAAVETALLKSREENNQLISYLESVFARLSDFDDRLADLASASAVDELSRAIESRLATAHDRADRVDARLSGLTERVDRSDEKISERARVADLEILTDSLSELLSEHGLTRELAATATSLSMALTKRVEENRIVGAESMARELAALRSDLEEAIEESRSKQRQDTEILESRLSDLPTNDDVIVLSGEIDLRLAELASKSSVTELADALDEQLTALASRSELEDVSDSVSALLDEHSTTRELATTATSLSMALNERLEQNDREGAERLAKSISAARAEITDAMTALESKHDAELKKLEIRLATFPKPEDVVALSSRLDEAELLAAVRTAKQLSELREELQAAIAEVREEHDEQRAVLESQLDAIPTLDDVAQISERVDTRLAVVPTANDVASLAKRVDNRIDDVKEQAEEAHVIAEKARDRAEFAGDGVAELQNDLEEELEDLRARLAEVAKLAESGDDGTSIDDFTRRHDVGTDASALESRESGRQSERIAQIEAALSRHAERLAELDPDGVGSSRRWEQWLTADPVRIPDSPLAALPPADVDMPGD